MPAAPERCTNRGGRELAPPSLSGAGAGKPFAPVARVVLRSVVVLLALAALASSARGVEDTVSGRTLALRQRQQKARLVLVADTPIVAPLPGTGEDPTLRGAVLDISNPRTGETARLVAPASGWSVNALGTVFRFRASSRATPGIRSIVIRHGRRLKLKATTAGITLDEPEQGVVAVVLACGTRRYCMLFGGDVRRDEPGKFAARNAPAPSACPGLADTVTTTTTSTSSTAGRLPSPTTSSTRKSALPATTSTTERRTSTTRRVTTTSTTSTKPPKEPKEPKDPKDPMDPMDPDDPMRGED
jgi:hypothetical protein